MDKKELRKIFSSKRDSLSFKEIHEKSLKICNIFFETDTYKNSDKIFTYINYKSEFETSIIVEKAFKDNKKVCVPVMSGKKSEMYFIEIKSFDELSKNKYGILEPKLDYNKIISSDEKTIIIVPALAFDNKGYRLGYGGGFYDNYLTHHKSLLNIGLAFDFQITDKLIIEEYDVPVDMIITETKKVKVLP